MDNVKIFHLLVAIYGCLIYGCAGQTEVCEGYAEVRMLAFMNLTTDLPKQEGFQEFSYLSLNESCIDQVRTVVPRLFLDNMQALWSGNGHAFYLKVKVDFSAAVGAGVGQRGLLVTSSGPTSVTAHKTSQGTSDSYLAYPLSKDGLRHLVVSYNHIREGHSSFVIAGVYADTCVEAWQKVNGVQTRILSVQLGANDVYHFMSKDGQDFTGTIVNSTRPIATYGGHECAAIPVHKTFCDHLVEQMPNVWDLGTEHWIPYITGRLKASAGWVVRIASDVDDNQITFEIKDVGTEQAVLDEGDYVQFNSSDIGTPGYVKCSKRCLVVIYNTGMRAGGQGDVFTDPFMMVVPPVDHWEPMLKGQGFSFYHMNDTLPYTNYLTIVAPTASRDKILMDGSPFVPDASGWTEGVGGMSFASVSVSMDVWTLEHSDGENFMAWAYGHNDKEPTAYGHPCGYRVNNPIRIGPMLDFTERTTTRDPNFTGTTPVANTPSAASANCHDSTRKGVNAGPSMTLYSYIDLDKVSDTEDCSRKYKTTLQSRYETFFNTDLNSKICGKEICRNSENTIGFYGLQITPALDNKGMTLGFGVTIKLGGHVDEPLVNLLACKKEIENYIDVKYTPPAQTSHSGCPDLGYTMDVDEQKSARPAWTCPSNF